MNRQEIQLLIRKTYEILDEQGQAGEFYQIVDEAIGYVPWEEYFDGRLGSCSCRITLRYNRDVSPIPTLTITFEKPYSQMPIVYRIGHVLAEFGRTLMGKVSVHEVNFDAEDIAKFKNLLNRF